ncbi:hypothetical protein HK100_005029 [Physocladia obscura]|uniref:LITAF domain-containing protein n=1 Tax=Physocladia obscura TaxID=109957 RepID=A0AAD5XCL7_9FUNG|nr:hypothetical protein HK100_005029 [Physocladia obscura]
MTTEKTEKTAKGDDGNGSGVNAEINAGTGLDAETSGLPTYVKAVLLLNSWGDKTNRYTESEGGSGSGAVNRSWQQTGPTLVPVPLLPKAGFDHVHAHGHGDGDGETETAPLLPPNANANANASRARPTGPLGALGLTFTVTAPPSVVAAATVPPSALLLDSGAALLVFCPVCNANVVTRVDSQPSCLAWLTAAFLCLAGAPCCFCLPLLAPRCRDLVHRCPNYKQ